LLAPWIEDRHPDHAAAGALVSRAVFFAGVRRFARAQRSFVRGRCLYYAMRYRMTRASSSDTSAVAAEQGARDRVLREPGIKPRTGGDADPTLISSPRATEAIDVRESLLRQHDRQRARRAVAQPQTCRASSIRCGSSRQPLHPRRTPSSRSTQ